MLALHHSRCPIAPRNDQEGYSSLQSPKYCRDDSISGMAPFGRVLGMRLAPRDSCETSGTSKEAFAKDEAANETVTWCKGTREIQCTPPEMLDLFWSLKSDTSRNGRRGPPKAAKRALQGGGGGGGGGPGKGEVLVPGYMDGDVENQRPFLVQETTQWSTEPVAVEMFSWEKSFAEEMNRYVIYVIYVM